MSNLSRRRSHSVSWCLGVVARLLAAIALAAAPLAQEDCDSAPVTQARDSSEWGIDSGGGGMAHQVAGADRQQGLAEIRHLGEALLVLATGWMMARWRPKQQ